MITSSQKLLMARAGAFLPDRSWDLNYATFDGGSDWGTFRTNPPDNRAEGVFFKPDGTKMYFVGAQQDRVYEYDLSTAWLISTAVLSQSFSVSAQTRTPLDLYISPDGLRMYITSANYVMQYDIGAAWDISTASYVRQKSVGSQGTYPGGVFFKPDGTKMYVAFGTFDDNIFAYDLSTAWDISTASYNAGPNPVGRFSVVGEEYSPEDIFFKPDGTKMYVVGSYGDGVDEYDLSVAWEIATATFVQFFSVSAQETSPQGLFFKDDGTKMYITGSSGYDINEYDLSTAWDISTAVYAQNYTLTGNPEGVYFKPDGTEFYFVNDSNNEVRQYTLSTAWDISTASFTRARSVNAEEATPRGIFFKPDGTKMYVVGSSGDDVNEYDLSTAWDISTATFGQSKRVISEAPDVTGLYFKSDGTRMYVLCQNTDAVYSYTLSTAWDVSTALWDSPENYLNTSPGATRPTGVSLRDDGLKMYVCGDGNDRQAEYDLSPAWDIKNATFVGSINAGGTPTGAYYKPDGTKLFVSVNVNNGMDAIRASTLSTAWDITTATLDDPNENYLGIVDARYGLFFKPDGTKLYGVGNSRVLSEVDLSTPWEITSGSILQTTTITQDSYPYGLFFKPDGTKMYVGGNSGDDVHEYDLSTAWDISTISAVALKDISPQETSMYGLSFNDDGSKMYVFGSNSDQIHEYNLGTAWSVSTASYVQSASFSTSARGIYFRPDGTQIFAGEASNGRILSYALSTPWDITTMSGGPVLDTDYQGGMNAIFFKDDGTQLYAARPYSSGIYQYQIG